MKAHPLTLDNPGRSLEAGMHIVNPLDQRTICDAIMTPVPNNVTFPINLNLLAGDETASDKDVRAALHIAFTHLKIVTEPGAIIGLAALLNGQDEIKKRTVATAITGGNIDAAGLRH